MAYALPEVSVMLSTSGDPSWPDVQLGVSPATMITSPEDKPEPGRGKTEETPGISVSGFYLRPKSLGSVAIRSARIEDPPKVHANWFGHPADREAAAKANPPM